MNSPLAKLGRPISWRPSPIIVTNAAVQDPGYNYSAVTDTPKVVCKKFHELSRNGVGSSIFFCDESAGARFKIKPNTATHVKPLSSQPHRPQHKFQTTGPESSSSTSHGHSKAKAAWP